jgi:hypothetical protein
MSRVANLTAGIGLLAVGMTIAQLGGGGAGPVPNGSNHPPTPNPAVSAAKGQPTECVAYQQSDTTDPDPNRGLASEVIDHFEAARHTEPQIPTPEPFSYAVALMPDPRHTHLSLIFDRAIEAVEQAAQDDGYTYNSSWLPWVREARTYELRENQIAEEKSIEERERCPGILLFRKSLDAKSSPGASYSSGLMVFVVGEQPTGGINLDQWDYAIQWLKDHPGKDSPADLQTLRVIGPTFSGSLPSLEQRLDVLLKPRASPPISPPVGPVHGAYVFSGNVAGCASIEWFQRSVIEDGLPVSFGAFQENDDLEIYRFLQYLHAEGADLKEVAILSEDETAYGSPDAKADNPQYPARIPQTWCDFDYSYLHRPVQLFYPRDISALRTAYQEQSIFSKNPPASSEGAHSGRTVLNSDVREEAVEDSDTVAAYSKQQSALGEESELYGLVSFLRAHHSQYVLLRSSNPLDYLFLSRFLHHAYPEGRVVTVGADMLFRREIDTTEFRGTMALTSYPLLPRLQHWTQLTQASTKDQPPIKDQPPTKDQHPTKNQHPIKGHAHRVFSSDGEEGIYLATRALLNPEETPDKIFPKPTQEGHALLLNAFQENVPDSADPFWLHPSDSNIGESRPDTWLTVVGRDGYWPVALLGDETLREIRANLSDQGAVSQPPPNTSTATLANDKPSEKTAHYLMNADDPPKRDAPPAIWWLCLVLILLAPACHICMRWEDGGYRVLRARPRFKGDIQQVILATLRTACIFSAVSVLFAPLWVAGYPIYGVAVLNGGLVASMLWFVLIVAMPVWLVWLKCCDARWFAPIAVFWGGLVISASLLIVIGLFLLHNFAALASDNALAYRALHLSNGVSPLPPLLFLLLGLYLCSWLSMEDNALLGNGRPILPRCVDRKDDHLERSRLGPRRYRISDQMAQRIEDFARPLCVNPWWVMFGLPPAAMLLCMAAFKGEFPIYSLEGVSYKYVLLALVLVCFALVIAGVTRLFCTWRELKRMLLELARTPLLRTFFALKDISVRSLWSMSRDVPRTQYGFFSRQLKSAVQLSAVAKDSTWDLNGCLDDFMDYGERFSTRYLTNLRSTVWWDQAVEHESKPPRFMRALIRKSAADVFNLILEEAWKEEAVKVRPTDPHGPATRKEESTEDGEESNPDTCLSESRVVRVAEEFVCLLYISYIQNILARMRGIILSVSAVLVSMMLAAAFYPFAPRSAITLCLLLMLIALGVVVGLVYAGMEQDKILSYITNTSTSLGWEFWGKYAAFLIPPVLALLTAQFPEIADAVASWVQPGLEAVR